MQPGFAASEIDTSKPHPAWMYDAYLGGNDNYPVDREALREIVRFYPEVRSIALANRAFLQRAARTAKCAPRAGRTCARTLVSSAAGTSRRAWVAETSADNT
jgi:hypothetical protein